MKKLFYLFVVVVFLMPINVFATENSKIVSIEYLEDGTIVETILEESYASAYATQNKTGTKTRNFKNSSGTILYTIKVKGTFTYTGSSSTCTSVSAEATAGVSYWKVASKSASKSNNKATAKATMKRYYDGDLIETTYPSVSLSCDKNGKLS